MARTRTTVPDLDAQVSPRRLMADTHALARWVRLSGSPAEHEAFRYIQRQMRRAGCATRLFTHDAFISLPGPAALTVVAGAGGGAVPCVTHSFAASTGPEGLETDAVFAGAGTPAELAAAGVAGRIAVVDGLASPDRIHAAGAAGAVGLVCLNRDRLVHEMIVSPVWGNPKPTDLERLPRLPVVSVAGEAAARLREAARAGGARLRLTAEVETGWRRTPILIADLPGSVEDTFVLFTGHVDSWHRGAMDNGTANATMMEVARVLAGVRRYRGVRFAFWSGHSHGRYSGSTWYADHAWQELHDRCVVNVNVDSVGARGSVINPHAWATPETRALANRVIRQVAGVRFEGSRVGRAGDHSFLGVGIPSMLMSLSEQPADSPDASADFTIRSGATGGLGWWWHTTDDLPDKIDPARLVRDCRVYLGIVHALATEPVLPLDYRAAAREWLAALRSLPRATDRHVALAPVVAEARRLVRATEALERRAAAVRRRPGRRAVRALNAAIMAMGRALLPAAQTRAGRFDHDPALEQRGVPLLEAARALANAEGDAAKHLAVAAQRDLNAVRWALRQAAEAAEAGARRRP
ncbi:MAG: M28 family peptidase [Armatimonadota bacterium]|nr:M28 family peptidase [Armatimonadota bacterium]MDR7457776.1 M28 family peptidase [Armatimonadota bacterium]